MHPRLPYYIYKTDKSEGGSYQPGDEEIAQVADGSLAYPAWYDLGSQPIHIFSVSELYFILSEVKLRLNEDATTEFQKAVAASVSEIMGWFEDDADANAYAKLIRNGNTSKGIRTEVYCSKRR